MSRIAPDGSKQTGTNTGFSMSIGDFEAFAGAEIVDPFAAAAKPGQVEFDAEIQVAEKFMDPTYSRKNLPDFGADVDFTQHSSGLHELPQGDLGNMGYDVSKFAPISKMNPKTGGESGEIDFKRRDAFLDGPGGGLGGTKRVNAGLGYQQVGGKHFLRKGDEMVELDMANYGTGDQGFFAMKNAYRRGEIDAQTFLDGKTAEIKGAMKTGTTDAANAQQPNFTAGYSSGDAQVMGVNPDDATHIAGGGMVDSVIDGSGVISSKQIAADDVNAFIRANKNPAGM